MHAVLHIAMVTKDDHNISKLITLIQKFLSKKVYNLSVFSLKIVKYFSGYLIFEDLKIMGSFN